MQVFHSVCIENPYQSRQMWCNLHSRESGCGLSAAHCSALDSRAHKTKTLSRRGHLNLWMCDMPFSLDSVSDLPRYVRRDTYQTVLDDKSGYDHILLTREPHLLWYPVGRMVLHVQYAPARMEDLTLRIPYHRNPSINSFPADRRTLLSLHRRPAQWKTASPS